MVVKLHEKIKRLQSQHGDSQSQLEIQKHIAESMYKDDQARIQKEAQLEATKCQKSDYNNLIANDDTSNSQVDPEMDAQSLKSGKVQHNVDL